MRKNALNEIYAAARRDPRVVFIGSDLGAGTLDKFRNEMPDRFFMEGVNEANIVGMAAGLASEGHIVWVNTIATFLTRRVYEQLAMDVCLHKLDVRLLGYGGGLVYAPLGPTHLAIDDIALMRAMPNMTILAPADAPECERLMRGLDHVSGPVYVRLGKGNEPDITREAPFASAVAMREGSDAVLLGTGVMLHPAMAAAAQLAAEGIRAGVLHCPVVKPLDFATIGAALANARCAVAIEEHVPAGGFASAIAEWLVEQDALRAVRFRRVGLPDAYPEHYGSQEELMAHYGLDARAIVQAVRNLI